MTIISEPEIVITLMRYFMIRIPYARFITKIHSVVLFIMVLLQTYEFSQQFDMKIFAQYGVFHLLCVIMFNVNLLYSPFVDSFIQVEESYKDFFSMDLKAFNTRERAIGRREVKKVAVLFVTVVFLNFITVTLFNISWICNNEEQMLIIKFLKRFVSLDSVIAQLVLWIIHIVIMNSIMPLSIFPIYFIYLVFHIKLKLSLLIDYVNNFNNVLKHEEQPNKAFIKMNIKLITQNHLGLKRHVAIIMSSIELILLVYIFFGIFISFICVYIIFASHSNVTNGLVMLVVYSVVVCIECNFVQQFVDDKQNFINSIYNIRWYNWDNESQRMFLILLTNASEGFQLLIIRMIQVDNNLVKRMFHLTYTVGNCFYSLRFRHNEN